MYVPETNNTVEFSLRDLRIAKGLSGRRLAKMLGISKSLYNAIELGTRKPSIDVLLQLSVLYGTSMDFIYHAYYRRSIEWLFPDSDLEYAMRKAVRLDSIYLKEQTKPLNL